MPFVSDEAERYEKRRTGTLKNTEYYCYGIPLSPGSITFLHDSYLHILYTRTYISSNVSLPAHLLAKGNHQRRRRSIAYLHEQLRIVTPQQKLGSG